MQTTALLTSTLLIATSLHAQAKPSAAIPATQPTYSVSDLPSARPTAAAARSEDTRVTWNGFQLTIEASGEPMPEVLGRVAHATGLKITGGVPDEHLYGKYGPGSVQSVLGQLFDGLSVNMMLVNDSPTRPKELILTARTGSATPPSTRQVADTEQPRRTPEPIGQVNTIAAPVGRRNPATGEEQPPTSSTSRPAFPGLSAPPTVNNSFTNTGNSETTPEPSTDTSNSSTTQPQSPNGVKTPEEIFEELRKRQQGDPP